MCQTVHRLHEDNANLPEDKDQQDEANSKKRKDHQEYAAIQECKSQ